MKKSVLMKTLMAASMLVGMASSPVMAEEQDINEASLIGSVEPAQEQEMAVPDELDIEETVGNDAEDTATAINQDADMINGGQESKWIYQNGKWYWQLRNGSISTGFTVFIDGKFEYFNEDGSWVGNGWVYNNGNYYFVSNNSLVNGWILWKGIWYYMDDETGAMKDDESVVYNGAEYCLKKGGAIASNEWVNTSDGWKFYNAGGSQAKGWLKQGATWYYLDKDTGIMADDEVIVDKGVEYYLKKDGAMASNEWVNTSDGWKFYNASGSQAKGWLKQGATWYYLDMDTGIMADDEVIVDKGVEYYLQKGGAMASNEWVNTSDGWKFYNAGGSQAKGWLKQGATWYYLDKDTGIMADETAVVVNGQQYYFSKGGALVENGWCYQNGMELYIQNNSLVTGWKTIGGNTYYFDLMRGYKVNNREQTIDGQNYIFNKDGKIIKNGWAEMIGGDSYVIWYYIKDSQKQSGFVNDGGKIYYMDPEDYNRMATGWKEIDGKTYFFNDSGSAAREQWVNDAEGKSYFKADGSLASGLETIGGKTYYFADTGRHAAAISQWIEVSGSDRYFGTDGAMARSTWVGNYSDNVWRYVDADGKQLSGWLKIGSKSYYLDPDNDNIMVSGCTFEVDGKSWRFGDDGALLVNVWVDEADGKRRYVLENGEYAGPYIREKESQYAADYINAYYKIDGWWYRFTQDSYLDTSYTPTKVVENCSRCLRHEMPCDAVLYAGDCWGTFYLDFADTEEEALEISESYGGNYYHGVECVWGGMIELGDNHDNYVGWGCFPKDINMDPIGPPYN